MLSGLVSHYRVVSTLGAGGMGVVHKAIDTRLNRPVAIKAIPEGLGLDTAAVLRLRAEAQSAASLDHPYICKIYELLDTDSGTLIVMEFVEGETLASMLLREGTLPVPTVLRYAAEIAEGLAAAHATGLVHRDVKPSNVMVTPHNHVKLLDFGIAHNPAAGPGATTTQSMQTRPGTVAGSAFYMAPEQALGRPVDGRTDIFSLGAVLFECLTGSLPFEGATRDAYVLDMLTGRPRSLQALAPSLPKPVADLVESCLERNHELRPDAATVAAYLRAESPTGSSTDRINLPQRRPWKRLVLTSLAFLALAVPAAWGVYRWIVPAQLPTLGRQEPLITWPSEEFDPRLSPDGQWVSFLSNRDGPTRLFVTRTARDESTPLTSSEFTPLSHVWSPDSSEIAVLLRTRDGTFVHVLSAPLGGALRRSFPLNEKPVVPTSGVRLARWIGSTIYLVVPSNPGPELWRLDVDTTQRQSVSDGWKLPVPQIALDVSPDGQKVVFAGVADGREDLWLVNIDGRATRQLTNDAHNERLPIWSRDGRTVVFQSTRSGQLDLWAIDVGNGQSWQLTSGQGEELFGESTSDGTLTVLQLVTESANLWKHRPGNSPTQLTFDALSDFAPTSGSSNVVVFQRSSPSLPLGNRLLDSQVLLGRLSANSLTVSTQPLDDGFAPLVSLDGNRVAYFQRPRSPEVPQLALRVRDVQSGQVHVVGSPAALLTASGTPLGWSGPGLAWGPTAGALFFIGAEEGRGYSIRQITGDQLTARATNPAGLSSRTLVTSKPHEQLTDLYISPSGRFLGYLHFDARSVDQKVRKVELREFDLVKGVSRIVRTQPWPSGRQMYHRGWIGTGDERILVEQVRRTGRTAHIGVVSADGLWRDAATIEEAFASSARVDAQRGVIYITRAEQGIHNVYSVSAASGDIRPVTNNDRLGISFSGFEMLPDGSLVYSLDRRSSDIWTVRYANR